MSGTAVLWVLLGLALLGIIVWIIARMGPTTLGPYSTRLLAVSACLVGYYGALSLSRHMPLLYHPVRLRALQYGVPLAGALALLYCGVRVAQSWQSELHGLLGSLYWMALVMALAALARWCLS